ncbi:MAG TPA: cyclic nucleotide-binding domain-containing protein [Kofleriaceae bacterium]|nr:cyclic nucleotide-binding domain-containing protein [Kofleriaceae bacterium]
MNRRAFALGVVMIALVGVVAVALRSFAEAAFLSEYGARQMPWLPIASAAGFAVATLGYDALVRRARAQLVDFGLLVALGLAAVAAPALLARGAPPVVLVVALAATSQVAGLALWNRVAAAVAGRDARRMLPRAGAAVTAGGAVAGLAAGAFVARLGLVVLPYAAAAVTLAVIALCAAQERALVRGGAPGGAAATASGGGELSLLQRRLLAALIAAAVLEAIVATVVDLQFLAAVKSRWTGDAVAIALALFYGATNAGLLLLQVAAVPRLLVTRSLPFTTMIHPFVVVASYLGFAAAPGFVAIAGTRTGDQVLRLGTSRPAQELALSALPVAPRARWKVLLRGALWPAGAGLAGLALLALGPVAPVGLAAAAIAVAVLWAIAARASARRFQTVLAAPLGIRADVREDPRRIDLATLERWTRATADPAVGALARAALARARVDAAVLADHLRDDDADLRAAVFEQLAREPAPALRGELRAAIAIEDDDRALAAGIQALALAGDDSGIARAAERAGLARDVDEAARTATAMLRGGDVRGELARLVARDPGWAAALARARSHDLPEPELVALLADAPTAGALAVIARLAPAAALPRLGDALAAGEPDAIGAIGALDGEGARCLAARVRELDPLARLAIARAVGAAPAGAALAAALVDDSDAEVAHAALRATLALARGGAELPADRIAAAHDAALAALGAHLSARDDAAGWSPCARAELDVATRRCVARLLWATAVDAAAAGRDPAPIAQAARHLVGDREADRRRALDVIQELAARPGALAAFERWLAPPATPSATSELASFDPWLARLARGELSALEPVLVELRRPALLASMAGPALAALAARAQRLAVAGELFRAGQPGDAMYVVVRGALVARHVNAPERRVETGGVIGELAVLTHAPRAATVHADGATEVLAIDRAAFAEASRRAPELVLALAATLAGWLASDRADVL